MTKWKENKYVEPVFKKTIKVESIGRDVTLRNGCRAISRQLNEVLYDWLKAWGDSKNEFANWVPVNNMNASNELAVKLYFELSSKELDSLTDDEYDNLLLTIEHFKEKKSPVETN